MPVVDRFMVQSYRRDKIGELVANEPQLASSPQEAVAMAELMQHRASGVLAYHWKGDMRTGEQGRLRVLKRAGALPMPVLEQIYSAATPY